MKVFIVICIIVIMAAVAMSSPWDSGNKDSDKGKSKGGDSKGGGSKGGDSKGDRSGEGRHGGGHSGEKRHGGDHSSESWSSEEDGPPAPPPPPGIAQDGCVFYNPVNVPYKCDLEVDMNTLISAQAVFRHGGRAPSNFFPNDQFQNQSIYWPEGAGNLTENGRLMADQAGMYLKNRYPKFTKNDIFVQSSDVQRAIDTVTYMLKHWTTTGDIPIHIVNHKVDNKLQFKANCSTYTAANNNFTQSAYIQNLYKNSKTLFAKLQNITGLNVTGFQDVYLIADALWTECQNGHPVPKELVEYYPKQTQPFHNLNFVSWTATTQMARLEAGPLFYEMIQNFKMVIGTAAPWINTMQGISVTNTSKLFLYSAHDPTIAALLNSIGVYGALDDAVNSCPYTFSIENRLTPVPPLYTSMFLVELHCRAPKCTPGSKDESNYDVDVYIKPRKDEPAIEVLFPECQTWEWSTFTMSTQCSFKQFQGIVSKLTLNNTQWQKECFPSG